MYCAQLSGLPSHVLNRALQIQALHQKGQHVSRVDNALQKARDAQSIAILKGIAQVDIDDSDEVTNFFEKTSKANS